MKPTALQRAQEALASEVEALTRLYIGKDAEGEAWGDTLRRLDSLAQIVRRVRRAQAQENARP